MTAQLNNPYTCLGTNTSRMLIVLPSEIQLLSGFKAKLKYPGYGKIQKINNIITNQGNCFFKNWTEGVKEGYCIVALTLNLLRRKQFGKDICLMFLNQSNN